MTEAEQTLRRLLSLLEATTRRPSNLAATKLNRERLKALQIVIRGWRRLAGDSSEDIDALTNEVGAAFQPLLKHLKAAPGKEPGKRDRDLAKRDAVAMRAIADGATVEDAILSVHGADNRYAGGGHKKRIERLKREARRGHRPSKPGRQGQETDQINRMIMSPVAGDGAGRFSDSY